MATSEPRLSDSESDSKPKYTSYKKWLRQWKQSTERYIEDPSVIILFLLTAYVDILLGSCQLHGDGSSGATIEAVRRAILCLQAFELAVQMCVFRVRFFSRWGYVFDTALVATQLFNERSVIATKNHHLHLLSFL